MIIMYNNLLKRILFPSLSIYFFPHFFTFFPIPKSKFRRIMGKNGNLFYFENRNFVSLSFHILFSPFLPILKSKFWCVLGKNGVGPPPPPGFMFMQENAPVYANAYRLQLHIQTYKVGSYTIILTNLILP